MRRRNQAIVSLLLSCAVVVGAMWATSNSITSNSIAHASAEVDDGCGLTSVNAKAQAAKGGDEAAIRELADEMFRLFQFDQAPAGMDDAIKERLVRAEINYRWGSHKVDPSEFRVVHVVNRLADRLGAPAYARTNVFEVRRLRTDLLPNTADLQTLSMADELGAPMSPLERLLRGLAPQQKRHNVEFQLTNDEWRALHGGRRAARTNEQFRAEMEARRGDSSRGDEIEQAIDKGFAAMSAAEMFSLPEQLLDTLGVER